jgi:HSP20 family molecular chaperone IbpA
MNENTKMTANRQSSPMQERGDSVQALRPAVNIFEDADGITLEADMPGVSKDRLQLQVERDQLVIEGDVELRMPEGMEALYADIRATRYSRAFALSRELDAEQIDASLKNGVLRLRIPKRAEVRPRKIEVRVD